MKKVFYIFILLSKQILGQTETLNNIDIKQILSDNKFEVTKTKTEVPFEMLNKLGVDTITEIAHHHEKWSPSCVRWAGVPHIKLNWAAKTSNNIWFICLSYGQGYSGPAIRAYLFLNKEKITIDKKFDFSSFKIFKKSVINNRIEKF